MTYLSRFTSHFANVRFLLPFLAILFVPATRIAATEEGLADLEGCHAAILEVREHRKAHCDHFRTDAVTRQDGDGKTRHSL